LFWTSTAGRKPNLSDSKPGELSVPTSFHSEVSQHLKIVILIIKFILDEFGGREGDLFKDMFSVHRGKDSKRLRCCSFGSE